MMGCEQIELALVIPLYNERDNVLPLHRALHEALDPLDVRYELIIVDDGSQDGSGEMLAQLAAQDPALRVIRFRRNYGQTAGFAAGFAHARGKVVVTMDADLQNDPQDIAKLLAEMEDQGADIVSGWRQDRKEPFLTRRLPSQLANGLISRLSGVHLHDYGCSLKAYRREVVEHLHLYGEQHRFIPALASQVGAKVVEVPVRDHPRLHGSSKYGLSRTLRVILDLITLRFLLRYQDRPMQCFGRVALGFEALSALTVLIWLVGNGFFKMGWPGWSLATLATGLASLGVLVIMLGLVAEMVMRAFYQGRGNPVYVIRQAIGFDEMEG